MISISGFEDSEFFWMLFANWNGGDESTCFFGFLRLLLFVLVTDFLDFWSGFSES